VQQNRVKSKIGGYSFNVEGSGRVRTARHLRMQEEQAVFKAF